MAKTTVPKELVPYLPKGHELWFAEKNDPERAKPKDQRNPEAHGGTNRADCIICLCGQVVKLDPGESLSDERWLEAVNACRMATHSVKHPCPPITMEGVELLIKEAPEPKRETEEVVHAA